MDAVIHNAGVYTQGNRASTPEGHVGTLAINSLAPYLLTAPGITTIFVDAL